MRSIALTFDLWDTLVADDSDEPRRAAAGLPSKAVARQDAFVRLGRRAAPDLPLPALEQAWQAATADFRHAWKVEHHTPGVRWRLERAFAHLGRPLPDDCDGTIAYLGAMEAVLPPDPAPGVHAMLDALHGRYPLAIVSDAILTPGSLLRELMGSHGLDRYFDAFVFSDEAGASKPAAAVFTQATAALGVGPTDFIHIGDREETDVDGALDNGGLAVLYTGVVDRGSARTRASAVCNHHDALPDLVDRLAATRSA